MLSVKTRLLVSLLIISIASCTDLPRPEKTDAPASGVVLVVGSDFTSGFLSAYSPAENKAYRDITPVFNDSMVRYESGSSYILQRMGSDSLRRLDNQHGYSTLYEKSLGSRSNPQDVVFLTGNTIAVSYYNRNTIDIRSKNSGALLRQVDLSAWADADGYAEVGRLWFDGTGFLYAALQRLNRNATDAIWPPFGQSYLLKIDTTTDAITPYPLSYQNPVSLLHYNAAQNSLIFAAPGRFGANYSLDGACVVFSLALQAFLPPLITEAQLGYEITDCFLDASGNGVFLGNDNSLTSVFGAFDATTHTLTRVAATLSASNGGYFSSILLHGTGKVYLADRNIYKPGLRIFSGALLNEETAQPIYMGLPPLSMEEVP